MRYTGFERNIVVNVREPYRLSVIKAGKTLADLCFDAYFVNWFDKSFGSRHTILIALEIRRNGC